MKENGIHIRVADILYGVMKRRVLIIALTAIGLLVGIVFSGISYLRGEMSKEYIVTSSFSVNTQTNSGLFTSGYDFPSHNDIDMAKDIVNAASYVLKSDKMLKATIDSLGLLGVTTKDIADNLKLTQYEETQIIEMTLYWRSSKEGMSILSQINKQAPEMLMETMHIGSVSVINEPSAKFLVGGSLNIVLWVYMTLLGLGLGIGITMLELVMHPTLLNVEEMEKSFGVEVLCEVAEDKAFFGRKNSILVEDEGDSEVKESFASVAHIIRNRMRKQKGPHIIYGTSALRGEGKTDVLANLAVRLSDLEKRVLLVDLDMKKPRLATLFLENVEYERSLNALYVGDITEKEAIISLTGYLDILPTVLEQNAIPLDSTLFKVIKKMAENYDYVLIDTAPVGVTANSMSLGRLTSQALFVVHYDMASMHEIKEALARIEKSNVSLIGCIVNGVQVSERGVKTPGKEKEKLARQKRKEKKQENLLEELNEELSQTRELNRKLGMEQEAELNKVLEQPREAEVAASGEPELKSEAELLLETAQNGEADQNEEAVSEQTPDLEAVPEEAAWEAVPEDEPDMGSDWKTDPEEEADLEEGENLEEEADLEEEEDLDEEPDMQEGRSLDLALHLDRSMDLDQRIAQKLRMKRQTKQQDELDVLGEAKAKAEARAKAKAKARAEAKAEARARVKAEARARAEAEEKAEARVKAEAETKARAIEAEASEAEAWARAEVRAETKGEAPAKTEVRTSMEEDRIGALLSGLTALRENEAEENIEVTTSDSFVELLFQAENNRDGNTDWDE